MPTAAKRTGFLEATANVRAGLVPHLAAPKLIRRVGAPERSFPAVGELHRLSVDLIDDIREWQRNRAKDDGELFESPVGSWSIRVTHAYPNTFGFDGGSTRSTR